MKSIKAKGRFVVGEVSAWLCDSEFRNTGLKLKEIGKVTHAVDLVSDLKYPVCAAEIPAFEL